MFRITLSLLACAIFACAFNAGGASPSTAVAAGQGRGGPRTDARRPTKAGPQTFMGSIGGRYKIQMRLWREGERLRGSYFYESVRKDIPLTGTISASGSFTLSEPAATGGAAPTGFFRGQWAAVEPGGMVGLTGNWSSAPDGSRVLPFALTEVPVAFSGTLRLFNREIREESKTQRYSIEVEYPQLEGAVGDAVREAAGRFNAEARAYALREIQEFKKNIAEGGGGDAPKLAGMGDDLSISYTLGLASDDLLSVRFEVGSYYAGAAHPNHNTAVINFDLRRARVLRLADLFRPSAAHLRAVADYCIADLKRQARAEGPESMLTGEWIEEGAAPAPENYRSWLLTREGIEITFDPYRVAPYAAGPQTVVVPYAALRASLGADSPVAPLLR